jgi:hypothetical protein
MSRARKKKGGMSGSSDERVIYEVYRHLAKHRGSAIEEVSIAGGSNHPIC